MSALKTVVNDANVIDFLHKNPDKLQDSLKLLELFEKITGEKAKMWGESIVGFGLYHYKSERSSQEGDWPLTGFSPRKAAFSLYLNCYIEEYKEIVQDLGTYKTGKGCLYIKKLADINLAVLEKLISQSFADMKAKYH